MKEELSKQVLRGILNAAIECLREISRYPDGASWAGGLTPQDYASQCIQLLENNIRLGPR